MNSAKFFNALAAMFRPPFDGLAVVVWLFFAWCYVVHPHSEILQGNFVDPDDPMRLAHTIDWLKGQSWFDLRQYRMDPPEGFVLPFSRFSEVPLAALILPLHWLGLPWSGAGIVASGLWPLILLGVMFWALRWVGQGFMPRHWAGITAYVALFATSLMFQFTPGRVDHHAIAALLTLLSLGCVTRMMDEPERVKWGLYAGFGLAAGQAIALEILPWLLALSGWVCAWMVVRGRVTARSGLAFGCALYVGSVAFLMVTQRPHAWFDTDALQYSVTYVLLAGGVAVGCGGIALAAQSRWAAARYLVAAALLSGAALLFLTRFPEMVAGPYGAMNRELAGMFFDNISEALPLSRKSPSIAALLLRIAFPLLGFAASLHFLTRKDSDDVWRWLLTALLLLAALLLATFYQARYLYYAMMFAVIPIAAAFYHGHAAINARWRGRRLFAAEIGLLLLAGPLSTVLLPALVDGRAFNTGVLLFPVQYGDGRCDTFALENILNSRRYYGDRPRLIMNMMDQGPEILFRTRHMALGGGYHMNVRGNLDSVHFFNATDPNEAEKIVRRRNVDLVVMCRQIPALYLGADGPNQFDLNNSGKVELRPTASFAEQLIYGKTPDWLERKTFPQLDKYLLFEVKPPAKNP